MKTEVDQTLTRAIFDDDLRLRLKRALHTPGVRTAQLYGLADYVDAYAEGRTLDEALEILVENHRDSVNVLACRGTVSDADAPTDPVDSFVYGGGEVYACRTDPTGLVEGVFAELEELVVYRTPAEIVDRVRSTGVAERHVQRGLTYETVRQNNAMRAGSVVTRCVTDKWVKYPWSWTVRRRGEGPTLGAALAAALVAEPAETEK